MCMTKIRNEKDSNSSSSSCCCRYEDEMLVPDFLSDIRSYITSVGKDSIWNFRFLWKNVQSPQQNYNKFQLWLQTLLPISMVISFSHPSLPSPFTIICMSAIMNRNLKRIITFMHIQRSQTGEWINDHLITLFIFPASSMLLY